MPNLLRIITAAALLAATGLASVSAVYAEQNPAPDTRDSHMGTGMRHGGMMGMQGGMMGPMSQMMGCNNMMQSQNQPPNSQFQHPSKPPQEE